MDETEIERLKSRVDAFERSLRVDAIQASGDSVDNWFHVVHEDNATAEEIRTAGMEAAKEVLNTKNRNRRSGRKQVGVSPYSK